MENIENIRINGLGVELTEETKNYLMKKLRSLNKFVDFSNKEVTADIRLTKETKSKKTGNLYKAEISVITAGKKYGAKGEADELLAAIDAMKDSILKKISSHKGKKQNLLKKGGMKLKQILRREIKK